MYRLGSSYNWETCSFGRPMHGLELSILSSDSSNLYNNSASTWQWMEEWADEVAELIRLYLQLTINYLLAYYKQALAIEICGIILFTVFVLLHVGKLIENNPDFFQPLSTPY